MTSSSSRVSLDNIMAVLNTNDRGIVLNYEASLTTINFLDLEISVIDHHLVLKTYFKPTDRDGYIPVDSCHHSQWLDSVARGQFLRLRQNCTNVSDFLLQSQTLKERFLEKGYRSTKLDADIQDVTQVGRVSLLTDRPKAEKENKFKWSFFTSYSIQHREIKKFFNKHWKVLLNDKVLGPSLPDRAGIIYRGARSIQGEIAPNTLDPPHVVSFFQECKGYFLCRKCNVCLHNICGRCKSSTFVSTVTMQSYTMKHFTGLHQTQCSTPLFGTPQQRPYRHSILGYR